MKVTVAVAALAAAASATSELSERQAGHNSKPCPNKPAVSSRKLESDISISIDDGALQQYIAILSVVKS